MNEQWKPGDRVVWPHKERCGRGRVNVRSPGTVTALNEAGLPPGVRVQFDRPVHGVMDCYATHGELEPEQ